MNKSEVLTEHPTLQKEPRKPFTEKFAQFGRRVLQFVRRGKETQRAEPQQAFNIQEIVASEKKISPERARRISEQGCAVRAIMSAAAFASDTSKISATQEEWDARLNQFPEGNPVRDKAAVEQELMDLYKGYATNDTPLGNALKKISITMNREEAEDKIKARIRSGEQVMVFTPGDAKTSHIFHAGLDRRGKIISLSDEKTVSFSGKKKFRRTDISHGAYTTFSVTPT
jgi:hypothetical protein